MATFYKRLEALMSMVDATWRRHANPWSGWTRLSAVPLIVLAIWSRVWIGWWALLPLALALLWTWANPRAFPPPARFDAWMKRGVMGERILLDAGPDVPAHHRRAAAVLSWLSLPGTLLMAWGLWVLDPLATGAGMLLAILPKFWFLDRMVWLHADWRAAGRDVPGFAGIADPPRFAAPPPVDRPGGGA